MLKGAKLPKMRINQNREAEIKAKARRTRPR